MIKKFKVYYNQNEFARNLITLMTGTSFSQLLPILITPILTRLYSPEIFGLYGVYLSVISILSVFMTFRLEYAIVLPEKKEDSLIIFNNLLVFVFIQFTIILVLFLCFYNQLISLIGIHKIGKFTLFIPLALFLFGIYQAFVYLANRIKKFKSISRSLIIQSIVASILSITLGIYHFGAIGLIIANICSQAFAVVYLLFDNKDISIKPTCKGLKKTFTKYKNFPLFDMPNVLIASISLKGVNTIFINSFGSIAVGFYSITDRIIITPFSVFTYAFSQTFYEKISRLSNNIDKIKELLNIAVDRIILILIIPYLGLVLSSKYLLPLLLGNKWTDIHNYVFVMAPFIFYTLILSPFGNVLRVINKQHVSLLMQIHIMIVRIISIIISIIVFNNILKTLLIFSFASFLSQFINMMWMRVYIRYSFSLYFISAISLILFSYVVLFYMYFT